MEVAGASDATGVQAVVQLAGQWAKQSYWALGTDADVLPSHSVIISACDRSGLLAERCAALLKRGITDLEQCCTLCSFSDC